LGFKIEVYKGGAPFGDQFLRLCSPDFMRENKALIADRGNTGINGELIVEISLCLKITRGGGENEIPFFRADPKTERFKELYSGLLKVNKIAGIINVA
jgi:hypothetical protein